MNFPLSEKINVGTHLYGFIHCLTYFTKQNSKQFFFQLFLYSQICVYGSSVLSHLFYKVDERLYDFIWACQYIAIAWSFTTASTLYILCLYRGNFIFIVTYTTCYYLLFVGSIPFFIDRSAEQQTKTLNRYRSTFIFVSQMLTIIPIIFASFFSINNPSSSIYLSYFLIICSILVYVHKFPENYYKNAPITGHNIMHVLVMISSYLCLSSSFNLIQ